VKIWLVILRVLLAVVIVLKVSGLFELCELAELWLMVDLFVVGEGWMVSGTLVLLVVWILKAEVLDDVPLELFLTISHILLKTYVVPAL